MSIWLAIFLTVAIVGFGIYLINQFASGDTVQVTHTTRDGEQRHETLIRGSRTQQ